MRRIDGARDLRTWVEREVEVTGKAASEGLHEIRARWETELKRLQQAEGKLLRLQEQVRVGFVVGFGFDCILFVGVCRPSISTVPPTGASEGWLFFGVECFFRCKRLQQAERKLLGHQEYICEGFVWF